MTHLPPATADRRPPGSSPEPPPERAISVRTLLAGLALVVLAGAAIFWSQVLLLFFAAVLIAIALRAGARGLHRLVGLNMKLGVIVVILAVIAAIAAMARLSGPAIMDQFAELTSQLPQSWDSLNDWIAGNVPMGETIQSEIEGGSGDGGGASEMVQRLPDIFGTLSLAVNTVIGSLSSLLLMVFVAIYVALESDVYRRGALKLVPPAHRDRAGQILDETGRKLALWMGGQALDMLAVAAMSFIGLWLLGVPLAFLLAVIAGLTNIVPIIGPFVSGAIASLFAFTQGFDLAVQVAILFVVIQMLDGEVILPLIQRYAVSLPPAMTVLAIMAFGSLFGFVGVVLATPLLVVVIIVIRRVYVEDVLGDRAEADEDG